MIETSVDKNSVCCIIVTYNIGRKFLGCFNAIKSQTEKVVIVDNGSDKETLKVLKELSSLEFVHIIYNSDNMGIAYALNQGVKYAEAKNYKWVLTMDNDSKATPSMVKNLLKTYEGLSEEEKLAVVSIFPKYVEEHLVDPEDISQGMKKEAEENFGYKYITAEITSGNLLKTEIFRTVGYYAEKLFIDYVDIEFCLRLVSKNYKLIQSDSSTLLHNLGKSEIGKLLWRSFTYTNHSALRRYYITRNRIYVWKRYLTKVPKFVLNDIVFSFKDLFKVLAYEKERGKKLMMIFKGTVHAFCAIYGQYKK